MHESEKHIEQKTSIEHTLADPEKLAQFNEVDRETGATLNVRYRGQIIGRWLKSILNRMVEEEAERSEDFIHNTQVAA